MFGSVPELPYVIVDRFITPVERDTSIGIFSKLADMVDGMSALRNPSQSRPISYMDHEVANWFKNSIANHMEKNRIETILVRINTPINIDQVHEFISEVRVPGKNGELKSVFPLNARQLASFLISRKLQSFHGSGPIVVVTPSVICGKNGNFLVAIGQRHSIYSPVRPIGVALSRVPILPRTMYLVRGELD